jgi:hypothetical protein
MAVPLHVAGLKGVSHTTYTAVLHLHPQTRVTSPTAAGHADASADAPVVLVACSNKHKTERFLSKHRAPLVQAMSRYVSVHVQGHTGSQQNAAC